MHTGNIEFRYAIGREYETHELTYCEIEDYGGLDFNVVFDLEINVHLEWEIDRSYGGTDEDIYKLSSPDTIQMHKEEINIFDNCSRVNKYISLLNDQIWADIQSIVDKKIEVFLGGWSD